MITMKKKISDDSDRIHRCPVTELPIFSKPDWLFVNTGEAFRATYSVLGESILLNRPFGFATLKDAQHCFRLYERVITEAFGRGRPYIQIEDCSNYKGSSRRSRKYYINAMKKNSQLSALIFCGLSPMLKISLRLGKRLNAFRYQIRIAEDYSAAIKLAQNLLDAQDQLSHDSTKDPAQSFLDPCESHGRSQKQYHPNIMRRPEWQLQTEGFTTRFEVIDKNILHSVSVGYLKDSHIQQVTQLREKVNKEKGRTPGFDYIIAGVAELEGVSRKARRCYMDSLKEWHTTKPFRFFILYGVNRFLRTATSLAGPFLPFRARVAKDIDEAFQFIRRDKEEIAVSSQLPAGVADNGRSRTSDQNQRYVDEILYYLGSINWETNGFTSLIEVPSDHPFRIVFEAVALIKGELDELFQERNRAEEALTKARDELEGRVEERTAALLKVNEQLLLEIEERKRVEENLRNAKEIAESANRSKSEFLANMSHELRTPLNHIIGFTEMVADKHLGELNETQVEYLNDVLDSSEHLLSLIEDVLDLAKMEAGKLELNSSDIDLKPLLENSIVLVNAKATKRRLQLSIVTDGIPQTIKADERKLKKIIYNLLSNAVKYTPDGGSITLNADCLSFVNGHWKTSDGGEIILPMTNEQWPMSHDNFVQISVTDTGIGIKLEDLERIFDHFEQVDGSSGRRYQGTGLGLSLAKNLVEIHGGRIWAQSDGKENGSTFRFVIPVWSETKESAPNKHS